MKEFRENVSLLQIIGASVSLVVTIVLLFTGNDTLMSLSVGLLVAILTQLLEIQTDNQSAEKRLLTRLELSEDRLLTGVGLSNRFFDDPWLAEQLEIIATDYSYIRDNTDLNYFVVCGKDTINECRKFVHELTEGYASIPHRSKLGLELDELIFSKAKHSIWSVAVIDMDYWRSPYGRNFLLTNVSAKRNGAEIVRIFMCSRENIGQIVDILASQREFGFKIYFVPFEEVKNDLQFDYHIVDSRIFTTLETTSGTEQITSIQVSVDTIEVERWVKKFNITLRHAQPVDEEFMRNLGYVDSSIKKKIEQNG